MKQLLFSFLFILTSTLITKAQKGTISGKVTINGKEPVIGAVVSIDILKKHALTDLEGNYVLEKVPYGDYTVEASSIEILKRKLSINVNCLETLLNISAKANDKHSLTEVIVEGKTEKRRIETEGFAVNVIDTKTAAKRNLQTNELLNRTVGVRVLQSGGLGSEVQYNLNGMTGRSVGIFIDGIEISTYGTSFNLNSIPPAMIERIEVYKGVLPAHLSGDLLGGAINIILKKGEGSNNFTLSTSYGSFNTFQSDFSGMYRNEKNGFTAKASGFYTSTDNNYEIWGKFSKYIEPNGVVNRNYRTKRFWDGYKAVGGRFEAGFTDVKWADVFLVSINGSDDYKEIQHGQTMGTPYMGRIKETKANVFNLNYIKKDFITKGLDFNFNGVYSDRETYLRDTVSWAYNWDGKIRTDLNGNPLKSKDGAQQGAPVITNIDRKVTTLRYNLSYELFPGHKLSANHVYYTVDREDTDLLRSIGNNAIKATNDLVKNVYSLNYELKAIDNKLTSNIFTKFYQQNTGNNIPVITNVNGQNQLSIDRKKNTTNSTGYGVAVAYAIVPKVIFISSAERAVRMPSGDEIFGSPADNILPNSSLKQEVSDNINTGFRLGAFRLNKHKVSFSSNVFWRNTKDKIIRRVNLLLNDAEIEVVPFVNLGSAQSLGFEGEASYTYNNNLNIMVNFSKFNSLFKDKFDPITGQQYTYYNKQIPNEPFFTINGNIQYSLKNFIQKSSLLNIFYNIGYVAPFRTIWPESDWFTTPAQYGQNIGFSYKFPKSRFIASLDFKNIFNAEIYDNYGVQKPGRAAYFKLNYSINKF